MATTNPDYRGVYVFTNDLPVFSPEAPVPSCRRTTSTGPGGRSGRPRSSVTTTIRIARWPISTTTRYGAVVTIWRERTRALQRTDGVAHVLIFENRGAVVGTSNPHPHCQIYAGSLVYATMEREAEVAAEHHRRTGRSLLGEVIERELAGPRLISTGEHFFACVPWFAQYAYEVHVLPRQPRDLPGRPRR